MEKLNRYNKEIAQFIKKFLTNETLRPDNITGESYQMFKEELTHVVCKIFKKMGGAKASQLIK